MTFGDKISSGGLVGGDLGPVGRKLGPVGRSWRGILGPVGGRDHCRRSCRERPCLVAKDLVYRSRREVSLGRHRSRRAISLRRPRSRHGRPGLGSRWLAWVRLAAILMVKSLLNAKVPLGGYYFLYLTIANVLF